MTYNDVLTTVKKQNPDKSHKECQQMAKQAYQNFKNATMGTPAANPGGPIGPSIEGAIKIGISSPDLLAAEKKIRASMNINSIISIGMEVIPDGTLVKHGKTENGVNTKVTFENTDGRKLPEIGYFYVFI
jgi:hypothetical protein